MTLKGRHLCLQQYGYDAEIVQFVCDSWDLVVCVVGKGFASHATRVKSHNEEEQIGVDDVEEEVEADWTGVDEASWRWRF